MGALVSHFSMSLDGFIALPDDSIGGLFDWFTSGDVEFTQSGDRRYRMSAASAEYWQSHSSRLGALVCGRRLFDTARGWGGDPPMGVPAFVVTHRPPPADWPPRPDVPVTFVGDLESAVAQAKAAAGDLDVAVSGANVAQQCLRAGLLEKVFIDLVPIMLGSGVRYFDDLGGARLSDPYVVEGVGVTHLVYRVLLTGVTEA